GGGKTSPLELLDHGREELRRNRQVERVVPPGAALSVQLPDAGGELVERLVVGELARHEPDTLLQLLPDRLAKRRSRGSRNGLTGSIPAAITPGLAGAGPRVPAFGMFMIGTSYVPNRPMS